MSKVTLIGIDLAKSVFQVCGVDRHIKPQFNRQIRRNKLFEFVSQHKSAVICMEACSGSNYWGRRFEAAGFSVKLIPPQHVKPFVKGNKNDANDALAICEAAQRPRLHTVKPRSTEQTDCLINHRVRERRLKQRIQVSNQIRGLLNEYGIVFRRGDVALRHGLEQALASADNELTAQARVILTDLWDEWLQLDQRVRQMNEHIKVSARKNSSVQRLQTIFGVGELTSTAIWAKLGDGRAYPNGRCFAASLGLVPKEHSSGGRQRLGGITKRGESYLRWLLTQASHNVVRYAHRHPEDRLCRWAMEVAQRRGQKVAVLAVANKLARISWAILAHDRVYQPAGC